MTKEELAQYQNLKKEILRLELRIERAKEKDKKISLVHDKVKGSNHEFPYQEKNFQIEGLVYTSKKTKTLQKILHHRKRKAEDMELKIEKWISKINDSQTRIIFEMRYIDEESWLKISSYLGSADESYARKIHDRFLSRNS